MMVELLTRKRDMGLEDENDMEDMSGHDKSMVQLTTLRWKDLV
jgi:hypothetical protein